MSETPDRTRHEGITQQDMVHRLPDATLVDRVEFLVESVGGKHAVHVGFVDSGCWEYHDRFDSWLHAHLDRSASSLVGLDLDTAGVQLAIERGFEAYAVDCCDKDAVAALSLTPADVVIAGEVIEHLDSSGPFLDGLQSLVRPGGTLVVTTPNASGLLNAGAGALAGYEVNHPDHVTLYSCYTLTNLMERHGWEITQVATYVPTLKEFSTLKGKMKLLGAGARTVLALERLLGRIGRPFAADGLIVVARKPA